PLLDRVLRRPLLSTLAATAALLALAAPALALKTALPGIEGLPHDLPVTRTYERIQSAFPGGPTPAIVAVRAPDVTTPEVRRAIEGLRDRALASVTPKPPVQVERSRDRTVAKVSVPLPGGVTDERSNAALVKLRREIVPATVARVPGARVDVTGPTAQSRDLNALMRSKAGWVFAFVLGLAFVLLLVTFRSIVVPVKAIVLNLLSVAAAYGLLVAVFQGEWAEGVLGFESTGTIASWLPLFLFVVLFGLSMDYHVFILTRVREAFDRGMPADRAVAHGVKATAGVVTSAAVVMVAVFAVFATLGALEFKQMGVGLAAAVLIDATIVRAVLLPATMKLLGDRNWHLPKALGWLPRLEPEPSVAPGPPEPELDPEKLAEHRDEIDERDVTPDDFGRIAAQTAKQVILQRIREAERAMMYDEYIDRVGEVVTGIVQQAGDRNNVLVDLGKVEALLPRSEQVDGERYEQGSRIKAVISEVRSGTKGPQVILSRRDPELIKALFELEVPEIADGLVEIRGVAREPGYRSKIAVESHAQGVDPVGACVGPRGSRVRMVVSELRGEKIDIIPWNSEPARFVAKALSPARVREVLVDDESREATVIVPDDQLSLAIGKEGLNARLAARLTGWKVDIQSETEFARVEAEAAFEGDEEEFSGRCAAILSNGKRCPNTAVPGSRYCGIPAHRELAAKEATGEPVGDGAAGQREPEPAEPLAEAIDEGDEVDPDA
nr:transcription termination factor NusA [Actinomycetota bacterium]